MSGPESPACGGYGRGRRWGRSKGGEEAREGGEANWELTRWVRAVGGRGQGRAYSGGTWAVNTGVALGIRPPETLGVAMMGQGVEEGASAHAQGADSITRHPAATDHGAGLARAGVGSASQWGLAVPIPTLEPRSLSPLQLELPAGQGHTEPKFRGSFGLETQLGGARSPGDF